MGRGELMGFLSSCKITRRDKEEREEGKGPFMYALETENSCKEVKFPICVGKTLLKVLEESVRFVNFTKPPICGGIVPLRLLLSNLIKRIF